MELPRCLGRAFNKVCSCLRCVTIIRWSQSIMYRKNGATQFWDSLQPGDGAVLIVAQCLQPPTVGWWEGVVFSCGVQPDQSLCHQTVYPVGPPSLLMLYLETAGLFCFVIIFFPVCACWCFRIANFFYAQGRTYRRKNNNKKQGLITKFLF